MAPNMEPISAMPRARSLHDRLQKPKLASIAASPLRMTKAKQSDDVRDGKFFHVRVTVGYLTSLRIAEAANAARSASDGVVSAYVSFGLSERDRGEYDCATSCPIDLDLPRQNVKWPKGTDVKTSKRRLYFSVLLRSDDNASPPVDLTSFDDDDSSHFRAPSQYAPEFLNMYIGLRSGEESIVFAAATLVLTGEAVRNQQIDLPVRKLCISYGKSAPQKVVFKDSKPESTSGRNSLLKNLFGARKSSESSVIEKAKPRGCSFARSNKIFSCEKNSVLHIKVDVKEGLYETNGPGLWGDLEDDEESFGPLPVIDIPNECTDNLTQRYNHESIEVFAFKRGTTIIATPGHGEAEEKSIADSSVSVIKQKNSQLDEFLELPDKAPEPLVLLCSHQSYGLTDRTMKSSNMIVADNSLSSGTGSESSSALSSMAETSDKKDAPHIASSETATNNASEYFDGDEFSSLGETFGDETETDDESAPEIADGTGNLLLRYASRLGVTVDELLADGDSSRGSSTYGSSKGTQTIDYPGNTLYPGSRSLESSSFASGDQSTISEPRSPRLREWFR